MRMRNALIIVGLTIVVFAVAGWVDDVWLTAAAFAVLAVALAVYLRRRRHTAP